MRSLLFAVVGAFASLAGQAQSEWIRVAETDSANWEVKPGSLEVGQTRGNVDIVFVIGRLHDKTTKQITVGKWYVSLADCNREMGKLVILDLDGKFRYENEFVYGAGSAATGIAEAICGAHSQQVKARDQKGI